MPPSPAEPIWTTMPEETGLPRSVNELVDLRYRPEVNTIGALAESDSSEHVSLAEPIYMDHHARGVRTASESEVNQKTNR